MNVEIYIDRMILDGYDHLNKAALNEAVQEHLAKVISQRGLPNGLINSSHHRKLDGGAMTMNQHPKTGQLGSDIASRIFNGLNNTA